jgi:hypothetical protein
MIFDESVKEARFSIDLQDVSFARALDLIFLQNKLTFEVVDRKTIFIYADNPTNKQRFERFMIKTFYLGNAKHDVVRTALQSFIGAAGGGRIVISIEPLNAVLVRATAGELQMLQELINGIDKNRAEVVIDVSIYEISRTDALQLGNQLALTPSTVNADHFDTNGQPVTPLYRAVDLTGEPRWYRSGGSGNARRRDVRAFPGWHWHPFGLPPTGVSLLQATGTVTIALQQSGPRPGWPAESNQARPECSSPDGNQLRLRRWNGGHQYGGTSATGQAGTSLRSIAAAFDNIQYKDVGLVIDVTPTITNEGYVEIKMKLESSSVEDSGETANLTPTFAQRSLATTARVLDGVTAVVAVVSNRTTREQLERRCLLLAWFRSWAVSSAPA